MASVNIIIPILYFIFTQFSASAADKIAADTNILASQAISMEKRYSNSYVNDIFKDNILLNMAYLSGNVMKKEDIDWDEIRKPFEYKFTLRPGEAFAYHEDVMDQYKNSLVKTTNANFNYDDGFKFSGYLVGDGVCHLASLIYWVSKTAGLSAYAPTNHDFAAIPEIEKKYGVAIYKMPGNHSANATQNLYITNSKKNPVVFEFIYKNSDLKLSVYEEIL